MNLLHNYIEYVRKNQLFHSNDKLLIAVSGGIDSVALCHLSKEAGFDFSIAHCNFQLRGEESERDEVFVRSLASELGVVCYVKRFDTQEYASEQKLSIQEAARELRYNWFHQIINGDDEKRVSDDHPFLLLTAHHLDDSIETLLMNFFKGTGITGLHGILPKHGKIVRPLLFATKENIVEYAKQKNLLWVEDSSNKEEKYTRNFFRNTVIPEVEKVYPEVKQNLAGNIERFKDAEVLYQQAIQLHKKKLLKYRDDEVHVAVLKLMKATPLKTIIYEIIKDFNFSAHQVQEVIKLFSSETGKYISSTTHRILRNRAWLIISPLNTEQQSNIVIQKEDVGKSFGKNYLKWQYLDKKDFEINTDPSVAAVDAKEVEFPLILRKWKEGDYFYPLGMRKKKKVARFFIDQKLSAIDKENVWVLESHKKIVWIVGHRIDDRFKVADKTKQVLEFSLFES